MLKRNVPLKKVVILTGYTDLRYGAAGLASIIRFSHGMEPVETGTLFLFCGRKRSTIKGLFYEGDGFVVLSKKVTQGRYIWPGDESRARNLTMEEYDRLMSGFAIDSSIESE